MAGSLQDQLLNAGLVDKKKAKKIKTEKHKAQVKSRKSNTELTNEAAKLAQQAMEEERRKSQELNEQRKREAEQKAIAAQIRQIIEMNTVQNASDDNTLDYHFTADKKVKSLAVSSANHDLISRGKLAIATFSGDYYLIPANAATKIIERDSSAIVLLNDSQAQDEQSDEEDPYADYQVPDDLMW